MLVLDASIAVKLITDEVNSELAVTIVMAAQDRIAPDWMFIEVASALSSKVRYAGLDPSDIGDALTKLPLFVSFIETKPLLGRVVELSLELNHALYDCLYLALALDRDCVMITDDRKFLRSVSGTHYAQHVRALV